MSDSDTGETSRFKIKHIEPVTNVEDTANSGDNNQNASNLRHMIQGILPLQKN